MSNQRIDLGNCKSLAILVESIAGPLLLEHAAPIALEMDIDTDVPVPADPIMTGEVIGALTRQAIAEMPEGGELTVTACDVQGSLELEIADTGCDVHERATRLPLAAAAIGADLVWQNCPQGGGAVTVRFPRQIGTRRIAA